MQTSDWIALAAFGVALVGYLDNRRRISYTEFAFDVEPGTGDAPQDKYALRNTGTRRANHVDIDLSSVAGYEISGPTSYGFLDPGQSMPFWLTHSRGKRPDTIRVKFGMYFRRSRVVRFPQKPVKATAI